MRIRIHHTTQYAYDRPIRSAIQLLRMTPRGHDGQHVTRWRVETDADARLRQGEDPFGNITHTLLVDGPLQRLRLVVSGEVETVDTGGVLRGGVERFANEVYQRETPATALDEAMRDYAAGIARPATDRLEWLHALLDRLHGDMTFSTEATDVGGSARDAFALRKGVCQDLAHLFIGMARWRGVPARYVSGHLVRQDGAIAQQAAHAWAEAYVEHLGWVGFDPANGCCPTEAYVRVAMALDYLGASPVRGSRTGGGQETMEVSLSIAPDSLWREQ